MLVEVKKAYEIWLGEAKQEGCSPSVIEAENFIALTMHEAAQDMLNQGFTDEEIGAFVRAVNDYIENEVLEAFNVESYRDIYKKVLKLEEPRRTLQLSQLMDQVKFVFDIPLLNNEAYNKEHPEVIQLYREISNARNL